MTKELREMTVIELHEAHGQFSNRTFQVARDGVPPQEYFDILEERREITTEIERRARQWEENRFISRIADEVIERIRQENEESGCE